MHMNTDHRFRIRPKEEDVGLLVLRVGASLSLFLLHGWEKLSAAGGFLIAGRPWGFVGLVHSLGFPIPALFAVFAALGESVCALCVACGLFTRLTAAAVTTTMAVALYCSFKSSTPMESAYLYAIPFAVLTVTGPGTFSFDKLIQTSCALRYFRPVSR